MNNQNQFVSASDIRQSYTNQLTQSEYRNYNNHGAINLNFQQPHQPSSSNFQLSSDQPSQNNKRSFKPDARKKNLL